MKRPTADRPKKESSLTEKRAEIRLLIEQIGWGETPRAIPTTSRRRARAEIPDNIIPFPVQQTHPE